MFLLSLSVPVDCTALKRRGLNLLLSCISVCVYQLLESTHAQTSLLTKQVATFLTMNTRVISTLKLKKIHSSLHDNTLNQGHWLETVEMGHKDVVMIVF